MLKTLCLPALLLLLSVEIVFPCSAIVLKNGDQIYLAKNFDWTYQGGILIKNLRQTTKMAYYTHAGTQAQWTSKYGSITFNQNGKEMPYGGMNERGLAIEMLWLESTQYNINDDKPYVNELEWIQYQLDNYESVQEVVEHLNDLTVFPVKGRVHYILTDPTGASVVIEYLNGKPIFHRKEANICQTITNNSVQHSESYKDQIKGIPKNNAFSTYRYYQLEQGVAATDKSVEWSESIAFDFLKKVTIPKGDLKTVWSIVYNIHEKSISFFTDSDKEIKTIDLSELDFATELSYFDLNQNELSNLTKELKSHTEQVNYSYVLPSLIHLGFDEQVAKEISLHQFQQTEKRRGTFADDYFHFVISVPGEEEKKKGFLAVMDSEQHFQKREVVVGGYIYGNIGKGVFVWHIYGLKKGKYAMLAFVDDNQNQKLDFRKKGKPLEKYATFSDKVFANKNELTFLNSSAEFDQSNANIVIKWK